MWRGPAVTVRAAAVPKARDARVEAIRALHAARAGAVKARTATLSQLKAMLVTAPAELREQLSWPGRAAGSIVAACLRLRSGADTDASSSQPRWRCAVSPAGTGT
ncbi:hypothetical protein [Nonomuraea sp. NPDC049400]|uniref:hypothetical protein n=1 Tax=Nonomuraea sp. NPDC049400 TaxID=3364352 RepID=UPI0037A42A65